MHVVQHTHLPQLQFGGEACIAAAQRAAFQVWLRTLAPGAHGDTLQHAGELVVLALEGHGKLVIDGGPLRFTGPCTLLIPPGTPFQLANHGSQPLQLVWVFSVAPVPAV